MEHNKPFTQNSPRTIIVLVRFCLLLTWGSTMAWLSLTSSPPQIPGVLGWDKLLHAGAYGLFAFLLAQFLYRGNWTVWGAGVVAAAIATLYGGALEILQFAMQSGRFAEWWDLAADALGAAVGCVIFRQYYAAILKHGDDRGQANG